VKELSITAASYLLIGLLGATAFVFSLVSLRKESHHPISPNDPQPQKAPTHDRRRRTRNRMTRAEDFESSALKTNIPDLHQGWILFYLGLD
jgi:hypothetical protein